MAASEQLFAELAKALGRPSRTYRAAQAALDIPGQAVEGYASGTALADKFEERRLGNQTLEEALGGMGGNLGGMGSLKVRQVKPLAPLLTLAKAGDWREKFKLQQEGMNNRQRDRFAFVERMVGAKGNPGAVNQAKNALQGLGYVDQLWDRMAKLDELKKVGASTKYSEKAFPEINTLKQNVLRTAGFAEGGKTLTGTERAIIVDSFLPSAFDNPASRKIKRKIAEDYYSGTIDYFEAAKLLGPAGKMMQQVAESQKKKREILGNKLLTNEMTGGGESDVNAIFESEGL